MGIEENWRVHVPSKEAATTQLQLMKVMGECWSTAVRASDSIKEVKLRSCTQKVDASTALDLAS